MIPEPTVNICTSFYPSLTTFLQCVPHSILRLCSKFHPSITISRYSCYERNCKSMHFSVNLFFSSCLWTNLTVHGNKRFASPFACCLLVGAWFFWLFILWWKPTTLDALKEAISTEVQRIDLAVCGSVVDHFVRRVTLCAQVDGAHFEHRMNHG